MIAKDLFYVIAGEEAAEKDCRMGEGDVDQESGEGDSDHNNDPKYQDWKSSDSNRNADAADAGCQDVSSHHPPSTIPVLQTFPSPLLPLSSQRSVCE